MLYEKFEDALKNFIPESDAMNFYGVGPDNETPKWEVLPHSQIREMTGDAVESTRSAIQHGGLSGVQFDNIMKEVIETSLYPGEIEKEKEYPGIKPHNLCGLIKATSLHGITDRKTALKMCLEKLDELNSLRTWLEGEIKEEEPKDGKAI